MVANNITDFFDHICSIDFAAEQKAAQNSLDDIVARPWYTNSKEAETAARVRRHIEVLEATNRLDSLILHELCHTYGVCNADACPKIKDKRFKDVSSRIRNRKCLIQKLEHHLKTYKTVLESVHIVLPGHGAEYNYIIDPMSGISLVIQGVGANGGAQTVAETNPINIIDAQATEQVESPVLQPTHTPPPRSCSSPQPTPSPSPLPTPPPSPVSETRSFPAADAVEDLRIIEQDSIGILPRFMFKTPRVALFDHPYQHDWAIKEFYNSYCGRPDAFALPLLLDYGICREIRQDIDPSTKSRMVAFSGLAPETSHSDILDSVRGGRVLRVVKPNATSALVNFVSYQEARNYTEYINNPWRRRLTIRGATPRVLLVGTPSYPDRIKLRREVLHGATRCLEITFPATFNEWSVNTFFTTRGLWAFTETPSFEYSILATAAENGPHCEDCPLHSDYTCQNCPHMDCPYHSCPHHSGCCHHAQCSRHPTCCHHDGCRDQHNGANQVTSDTDSATENRPEQTPAPALDLASTLTSKRILRIYFKDIARAVKVRAILARAFPTCEVRHGADRCAGPLDELDL